MSHSKVLGAEELRRAGRGEAKDAQDLKSVHRSLENERKLIPQRPIDNAWNYVIAEILFGEAQQSLEATQSGLRAE